MNAVHQATRITVAELFRKQARIRSNQLASVHGDRVFSYAELDRRTDKLASALSKAGIGRGDRVAILSENGSAFLDLFWAAAKIGVIVATQNWRLGSSELAHCLSLVEPSISFVSERFLENFTAAQGVEARHVVLGQDYEAFLNSGDESAPMVDLDPEEGMLIVYTSGTTGMPKGALISQRALIARAQFYCSEFGIDREDTFFAYSPMFHIASADLAIATMMIGGKVVVGEGLEPELMRRLLEEEKLSNLIFFPGMVENVLEELKLLKHPPRSLKKFGALADLFPPVDIAAMTSAVNTDYTNTYASTETGMAPGSGGKIPKGVVPQSYAKTENNFCVVRLVNENGSDVADGTTGELVMRGPTLFSGYWNNPQATADAFAGGWYHTGDIFRRNPDGSLDYIDRQKYLVKSGGENIYPAEIERVVLRDERVAEALVVRRADRKWGEVPVLVVTRRDESLVRQDLLDRCMADLSRYKCPKDVFFVPPDFWPRNNTGKIVRKDVEEWVKEETARAASGR